MAQVTIRNSTGSTVTFTFTDSTGQVNTRNLLNGIAVTVSAQVGTLIRVSNAGGIKFTDNQTGSVWYGANDNTITVRDGRSVTLSAGSPPAPTYRTVYSQFVDGSVTHCRVRHLRGQTVIGTVNMSGTAQVGIENCTDGDTLIFDEITFAKYNATDLNAFEFPVDVRLNDGTYIGRYSSSFTLSVDSRYTAGVRLLLNSTRIYWKTLMVSLDRYDSEGKPGFNSATVDGGRKTTHVIKDSFALAYVVTNIATKFTDIERSLSNHRSAYPYSIEIRDSMDGAVVASFDFQRGTVPSFFAGDYAADPLYVNLKPAKIDRGLFSWFGDRDKEIIPKIGDPKSFTFYMKAGIWNSFVYAVLDLFECYNEEFPEYTNYLVGSGDEFIHTIFNGVKNKLRDMTLGKPGVLPSNVGPGSRVLPGYFHGAGSLKNGLNVGIRTYLNTAEDK